LLWIDTFVQAGGQSEVDQAGNGFFVGLTGEGVEKLQAGLFADVGKKPFDRSSNLGHGLFGFHLVDDL
jgi:hypothetical protein